MTHFITQKVLKRLSSLFIRAVVCVFISSLIYTESVINISAASTSSLNFQGKIAIKGTGTNITTDAPACILAEADTCDFRISYFSVATEGTSLYTEVFSDIELGNYSGIFNLALGLGSKTGGSETNFSDVFIENDSVFINIEFDASGSGDFTNPEIFTLDGTNRMQLRATPFAITAANISNSNNQIIRNQTAEQVNASFNIDGSGTIAGDFAVDSANNTFYVDSVNHNVGIGTTSPAQKLHVSGDVRIDGVLQLSPSQIAKVLEAADAANSDFFGSSISLSADASVLAVGADTWEGVSGTNRGGVYIYDWSGGRWVQRGNVLEASDAADGDYFGSAVSLSANATVLAVGAQYWEGASGTDRGGVYTFDWNGSAWVQRGSVLESVDAADEDYFGISVALSADASVLAVGAQRWEGMSGTDSGGVYVYDWDSDWVQRGGVLEAADAANTDYFGTSVALSAVGDILIVGAQNWEGNVGSNVGGVYVYDWDSAWVQRGNVLEAADASNTDAFGKSVAISGDGDVIVVGAQFWEGASGTDTGGAYIFDNKGSIWLQRGGVLAAIDATDGNRHGVSISISADAGVLVVGSERRSSSGFSSNGGVYTYSLIANSSPFSSNNNGIAWNVINNNSIFIGGNVGIGSSSADSLFTVGSSSGFKIDANGAITAATGITSSGNVYFTSLPKTGIGTSYTLNVTSTGLVWRETSSIRYKENVLGLTDNFDLILDINPVSFNYIGSYSDEIGFIAEELDAKGLSNLVIYDELGRPDGIKYNKLPIYLLEVIKRQQNDINSLYQLSNLGDLGDELHALNYLTVNNLTAESINALTIDTQSINTASLNVSGLLFSKQIETEMISASIGQNINILLSEAFGNTSFNVMNTDNVPMFTVTSSGDVRIFGKLLFDTESAYASVGTSVIPEDSQTIMIETLACTPDSKVFITLIDEEGVDFPIVKVVEKGEGYFVVSLSQEATQDLYLDWWVIN